MRALLSTATLALLLTVAALTSTSTIGVVEAFPFGKKSGVTELTPKGMNNFLNTHKPVFLMFYAPWCGHCKTLHPDWEKFGKGVKDVVKVGAIDADKHKEVGGQFGVKGFPTIKYWKMGSKKGAKPQDYNGQRTKAALHNAALAEIKSSNVKIAANMKQVTDTIEDSSAKMSVVLFTSKTKSPPMFSVLSQSPHFKGKIGFVLVSEKQKEITSALGISKFPSIVLLKPPASAESTEAAAEEFGGKMEYTEIAKYLKESLGESGASGDDDESSTSGDGEKKSSSGGDGDGEDKKKEQPPVEKKPPRPATPVRPVKLDKEAFDTFCAHGAPKVAGGQPFCMIFLGQEGYDLTALHAKYEKDSVLFFFAEEADALIYAEDFQSQLQPGMPPLERGDVIAFRAQKNKVKFNVWRAKEGTPESTDNVDRFIERAILGETTFKKRDDFPVLRQV